MLQEISTWKNFLVILFLRLLAKVAWSYNRAELIVEIQTNGEIFLFCRSIFLMYALAHGNNVKIRSAFA